MIDKYLKYSFCCLLGLLACQPDRTLLLPIPESPAYTVSSLTISRDAYYDKVLGALVGSAIGDAMGAGTEMWHRSDIQGQYGYIQTLTPVTRSRSPEGIWAHNMIAGSTTDDTRWKHLMSLYLLENEGQLSADAFANWIISIYNNQIDQLGKTAIKSSPDALDEEISRIDWIKEWARVAIAKREGGQNYEQALHRFYGGEMSCAGLLYTPMLGLIESQPYNAYVLAYDHALFDIGYAKDITAMSAALTSMTLHTSDVDSILAVIDFIDPYGYKDSRLIGRLVASIVSESISIVHSAQKQDVRDSSTVSIPKGYPGTLPEWLIQESIYQELENRQKAIAFHSGEIFQILITGVVYGNGDFEKSLQFIVNYGRDNDTVAALAGFILGAKEGFSNLPVEMRQKVLAVNKEYHGIDLEMLAQQLSDTFYKQL